MTTDARGRVQPAPTGNALAHRLNPRPRVPRLGPGPLFLLHQALKPNPVWRGLARVLEKTPPLYRAFNWSEEKTKNWLFGCRMCGQCALPTTAYACPQTCPKQLRNGPCGGVSADGHCEVYPEMRCVWTTAYERAASEGHVEDLRRLVRPIDHQKWGQSSWVNFWLDRDEELWTADDALEYETPPRL